MKDEFVQTDLNYDENEVNVYLFVGVNGVGKTTSIGKLAKQLKDEGKKVMMVAADTFRAGAIDQLVEWGKRSQTFVYTKEAGSDPSSVIYDALEIARKHNIAIINRCGMITCDFGDTITYNKKVLFFY